MTTGIVKLCMANRGYGFIVPDAGGNDLFFHIKNCANDIEELSEGQRVRFEERPSERKNGKQEAYEIFLL